MNSEIARSHRILHGSWTALGCRRGASACLRQHPVQADLHGRVDKQGRTRPITTRGGHELSAKLTLLSGVKRPRTGLATAIGLELDESGYVVSSPFGRTSNPLVWKAGNVSDQYLMWTGAASSGLNAAVSLCEELSFGAGKR